jgi:hypothetical protein
MLSVPAVNTSVTLDVPGWTAPRRTRVEDLDDEIVVADPLIGGGDHDPALGSPVTVRWKGARGPMELATTLVARELRSLSWWRLRPDGPVVITQRRHHARMGALIPLTLCTEAGPLDGHLVDLSEGGLRSVCREPAWLVLGDRVTAHFDVAGHDLAVAGEIVRVDVHDERLFAGCRFLDVAPRQADLIRKFVFERQTRERRLR